MPEDPKPTPAANDPLEAIVAALSEGGPRTAGQLADYIGIPYSTLTPRLRRLEDAGRAERATDPGTRQMIWQLTAAAPTVPAEAGEIHQDAATVDSGQSGDVADADDTATDPAEPAEPFEPVAAEPAANTDTEQIDAAGPTPGVDDTVVGGASANNDPDGVGDHQLAANAVEPGGPPAADADTSDQPDGESKPRRRKGTVAAEILAIARAHPDTGYKTGELAKATGISQGAIANAAHKLCASGELLLVCETPATFQAA